MYKLTFLLIILLYFNLLSQEQSDCWTILPKENTKTKVFTGTMPYSENMYKINLAVKLTEQQFKTYPNGAKSIIEFTVLTDGSTSDIKIVNDSPSDFSISEKQIHNLKKFIKEQEFTPGLCNGKAVAVPMQIPIIWKKE